MFVVIAKVYPHHIVYQVISLTATIYTVYIFTMGNYTSKIFTYAILMLVSFQASSGNSA